MPTSRRRWLVRIVAVVVLAGVATAGVALSGDRAHGCERTFDVSAWQAPGNAGRLAEARRLVDCETLEGRTRPETRALLGPEDAVDRGRLVYAVGLTDTGVDLDAIVLRVRFDRAGRVAGTVLADPGT